VHFDERWITQIDGHFSASSPVTGILASSECHRLKDEPPESIFLVCRSLTLCSGGRSDIQYGDSYGDPSAGLDTEYVPKSIFNDDSIMGDEESRSGFPQKATLMVKLRKMKGDVEALERVLSFM
jgi:hypothetical protein